MWKMVVVVVIVVGVEVVVVTIGNIESSWWWCTIRRVCVCVLVGGLVCTVRRITTEMEVSFHGVCALSAFFRGACDHDSHTKIVGGFKNITRFIKYADRKLQIDVRGTSTSTIRYEPRT